jgi:hypothetical protein
MIFGAYAAGLLFVDRLFRVVKFIYTLPWCATIAQQIHIKLAHFRSTGPSAPDRSYRVSLDRHLEPKL